MRKIIIILIISFLSADVFCDTTKVLFVGNSYTYVNDLPVLFRQLSAAAGKNVSTDMSAPGGYTLEQHFYMQATIDKINSADWDYVILQEQSQYPVIDYYRQNSTYPFAEKLDSVIRANNSSTMLYMTWGRKNGGQQCIGNYCSPLFTDYFHMQDSLSASYSHLSQILNCRLCPVGLAWKQARIQNPDADLWDADLSHPTIKGSYLAACLFYASIFDKSPEGINYYAGIDSAEAKEYQQIAGSFITGVIQTGTTIPDNYYLGQNYPNPFNTNTVINFSIPEAGKVTFELYDVTGRCVNSIIHTEMKAGAYKIDLDMKDHSSGIYYYTLSVNNYIESKKMVLVK